jgi:glycosyltransferase involved in cell wall biosynthesis
MDSLDRLIPPASPALAVDIALMEHRGGRVDVSMRDDADVYLAPCCELPFEDRAVASLHLGAAVATFPVREQIQLLLECRRVLAPAGQMVLAEAPAVASHARLARWAALVGLVPLPADSPRPGWTKRGREECATPLVSIAIPASNPRYFLESLDSAIRQTYPHTEIVICDDSEGDAIPAMATSRAGRAAIRYEKNPQRLRTRRNYEKCLALARGEYVKFLNDDDVLEPECVDRLLSAFREVPDLVLATSHRFRIDAQSRVMDDMPATRPAVARDVVVDGVSLANAVIMYGLNFIGEPSTALFRKRDFDHRAFLDGDRPFHFNGEEVRGAADLAMWSRLLVQGNAVFLHERLSRFRIHSEQAQAHRDVVDRSIAGIRALQHQWVELGLFQRLPPHLILVQPFPPSDGQADEWRLEPVLSLPRSATPPEEAVRAWRSTRRHAFDFT